MKRSSALILRRGISQLCKNGASTLTVTVTSSVVAVTKTYEPRSLLPESLFRVHPLVMQALADNKPVVALESTIITHGMPYPHNLRYFLCNVHGEENICNFTTAVFFLLILLLLLFISWQCYSALQRRWRTLWERKEPLRPQWEWSMERSGSAFLPRSWTSWLAARAPSRFPDGIFPTSLAKWGTRLKFSSGCHLFFFFFLSHSQSPASIWASDPRHPMCISQFGPFIAFHSGAFWRNDGVGHHDSSASSWHPCFCHRRHWRGSQRWRKQWVTMQPK